MATALSVRPTRAISGSDRLRPTSFHRPSPEPIVKVGRRGPWGLLFSRRVLVAPLQAGSRADDSAPFEMSVENALKVLGVPEGASFDDILRAKNSIIASCKDDEQTIAQSLSRRRAGKVVNSSIRYADVKSINSTKMGPMPKWLQTSVKKSPISVEAPSTSELGVQAGVYGALMVLTYANGASPSSTIPYGGSDVPGLILATSFGASLYFMTKKNIKLGKATVITIGGLVAGAVVGSAVENWLQVDIVPFMGINTPATVVSEFILFSQFLVSLYLR
ncbi:UNVERIFIED_CONTAM: hypothetical protein Slati_3315700 [Sesamum latifolium]|uniref:Protein CHAPERONE-LIKE PROTEIN OF POR1, chloroplastic n=1 Tax=Sesamum latifolium TaxID=2727402 RepID=A0AAW2V1Y5_9LAMI